MSYDLAVWEGDWPADDAAAGQELRRLYDRYIGSRDLQPPTVRIAAYVRARRPVPGRQHPRRGREPVGNWPARSMRIRPFSVLSHGVQPDTKQTGSEQELQQVTAGRKTSF